MMVSALGLHNKMLIITSCTGTALEEMLYSASHFVHATHYADRFLKYT